MNAGDEADAEFGEAEAETEEDKERGPNRRCVASGRVGPKEHLVRFVVSPDTEVVPDVEGKLPGRGIWLSAARDMVNTATAKSLFAKSARKRVTVAPNLADVVEFMLARRCLELLGLARRAGQVVAGYEKVRSDLKSGRGAVLLAAADAAEGGRAKVRALAPELPLVTLFSSAELGFALGRDAAVHVLVARGKLSQRFLVEAARLAGFRAGAIDRPAKADPVSA